jgi:predicted MFS family arabinose efflux permease
MLAFFVGGWMAENYGWRAAFCAAGSLGAIVVALLFAVKEPRRDRAETGQTSAVAATRALFSKSSFRWLTAAMALRSASAYGELAFLPSFLQRTHQLSPTMTGLTLGVFSGLASTVGAVVSGRLIDRLTRGDSSAALTLTSISMIITLPFLIVFFTAGNLSLALAAAVVPATLGAVPMAPSYAAVQAMAAPNNRAWAIAIVLAVVSVFGSGLGPQFVGIASDSLRPLYGEDSLRYALLLFVVPNALSAVCFWIVAAKMKCEFAGEDRRPV